MAEFISIDDGALLKSLENLRRPQIAEIVLKALRKGGEIIEAETKASLVRKLGPGATSTRHHDYPMLAGIHLAENKENLDVMISLYGDFRLKWFEMGTDERYLKGTGAKDRQKGKTARDKRKYYRKSGKENFYRKGTYRGRITETDFFAEARDREIGRAVEVIKNELTKELQNLLK